MDMRYLSEKYTGFRKTLLTIATLMLAVTAGSAAAATTATATLTINVQFPQPSCNIKVPSSYNLGTLSPGSEVTHPGFDITWDCGISAQPLKTALTAAVVRGEVVGNDKVRLLRNDGQATGASLFLKEKGASSPVNLTGAGMGAQDYFCRDATAVTGMRTCTLTPVTVVKPGGPFGLASATLRFKVGYP